jgi:predicted dehydrogenase
VKVGVVGYGYWGPNLVRNFVKLLGLDLVIVCDLDPAGRERARAEYPGIKVVERPEQLLADDSLTAVAIATPAATHRPLSEAAIMAGKHVLVEKPLATTVADGAALLALAGQRGLVLMSDHTFVFNPAVVKLKTLLDEGRLGRVQAILSNRMNLGLHRPDVDVVWDLYLHDLSIFQYWLGSPPESITGMGIDAVGTGRTDIAFLAARYPGGTVTQVNAAWLAPTKRRDMTVIGSGSIAVYDDNATEKLLLYANRAVRQNGQVRYAASPGEPVPVERTEAVECMARHFLDCIHEGHAPRTGPGFALDILCTLEAAGQALGAPGTPVAVRRQLP